MHEASRHRPSTLEIIKQVPPDGGRSTSECWSGLPAKAREAYGGYTDVYGRLAWSQTASTITRAVGRPPVGDLSIRSNTEV